MRNYKEFRLKLAGLVLVLFTGLGYQCAPVANEPRSTANSGSPSPTQPRNDDQDKLKNRYQMFLQLLDRESAKLKMASLRTRASDDATEIRLWVGFGLLFPRCVVIRRLQDRREAIFVGPSVIGDRAAMDRSGNVIPAKKDLGVPKSGWPDLDQFLKQNGIDSTIALAPDVQSIAVPDGESIVIEAKSKDEYSMTSFSVYSTSEDARKALEVCRHIEGEFELTMCGVASR